MHQVLTRHLRFNSNGVLIQINFQFSVTRKTLVTLHIRLSRDFTIRSTPDPYYIFLRRPSQE